MMMYHISNMAHGLRKGHPWGRRFVIWRDSRRIIRTLYRRVLKRHAIYRELQHIRMKRVRIISLPGWELHPVVQVGYVFGVSGEWQYPKSGMGYMLVGSSGKYIEDFIRIPQSCCEDVSWVEYIVQRYRGA